MQPEIHSGYLGLYRPPYTFTADRRKLSSIYYITTQYQEVMIIIPLVPCFFTDLYRLVSSVKMTRFYIIAPDVSLPFATDYFLAWDFIHRQLGHVCKIFTKFPFENYSPQAFQKDVVVIPEGSVNFSVPYNRTDDVTVNVHLSTKYVQAANPFACNVEVNDTNKRMLFVADMNERLAKMILGRKDYYDEVHIAYITGNYDGMTYLDTMKKFPALVGKIVLNQFASTFEYNDAIERNHKVGRLYQ